MKTNNRVLTLISTSTVLGIALAVSAATPQTKTVVKSVAPKTAVTANTKSTTAPSTRTSVVATTIHKSHPARMVHHTATKSKTAKVTSKTSVKG